MGRARNQPADHLAAAPVQAGQRHAHNLKTQLERDPEQRLAAGAVLRRGKSERVLGQLKREKKRSLLERGSGHSSDQVTLNKCDELWMLRRAFSSTADSRLVSPLAALIIVELSEHCCVSR